MTPERILCPRCGESLPADLDTCDACGADLGARAPATPAVRDRVRRAPASASQGVPGIGWLLLIVGLVVGGMVGYALHSAVGPRSQSGMPSGPADIMAGAGRDGGMPQGAPAQMPPQIMKMVQEYKATLAKNPDDLDANVGLGNLEFDSAQWRKAIDHYSRALQVDPRNADVRVDRAIAYHATGENETARNELQIVTREKPEHKNAWLNLGVVNRELGNRPEAVRAWERYLELDPNGEHAETIRQELATLKQTG